MNDFVDFELLIHRVGKRFRARVLRSPAGTGAGPLFDLPSSYFLDVGGEGRNFQAEPGQRYSGGAGQQLFSVVFGGPVMELWRGSMAEGRALRLCLRLEDDPRLASVPWELMDDPTRGPLGVTIPILRTLEMPAVPQLRPVEGVVRILTILSSPADVERVDIEREWEVVEKALGDRAELHSVAPRLDRLDEELQEREWHILHFVGHGLVDNGGGALVLVRADGSAQNVGRDQLGVFLPQSSLRLIVLNVCDGARPGGWDMFSGVAQTLLRNGVPAVIAMRQIISDKAAIAFAQSFYQALASECPLGTALMEARKRLYRDFQTEWGVPVLYLGSVEDRILPLPPPPPPPPTVAEHRLRRMLQIASIVICGLLISLATCLLLWPKRAVIVPPPDYTENPQNCPSPDWLGMAFVEIRPGIFQMGQEKGDKNDEPVHQVQITRSFCLGATEVTEGQWNAVMGLPPPPIHERDFPVQGITFEGAKSFLDNLNDLDEASDGRYRLPTEAEWEMAARAGTKMFYYFGDDAKALSIHANCKSRNDLFGGPAPVAQFKPNGRGLYDMYGNVFEWVSDWYGPYSDAPVKDPLGPIKGEKRIRRGGSWETGRKLCSSAARSDVDPTVERQENGFRIVREIR
jgi:formylglycine-generating enzyme required for sulfatase activity